jgi:hypothetical protein
VVRRLPDKTVLDWFRRGRHHRAGDGRRAGRPTGATTYAILLTFYESSSLDLLPPVAFPGVALPELAGHLRRMDIPDDEQRSQGSELRRVLRGRNNAAKWEKRRSGLLRIDSRNVRRA